MRIVLCATALVDIATMMASAIGIDGQSIVIRTGRDIIAASKLAIVSAMSASTCIALQIRFLTPVTRNGATLLAKLAARRYPLCHPRRSRDRIAG